MRGKTDVSLPKWKGKQQKKESKQHIYYSPTRFLPTMLFASPAFTHAPLWSASLMSQLCRRETSAAWKSSLPRGLAAVSPPRCKMMLGSYLKQLSSAAALCLLRKAPQSPAPAATQPGQPQQHATERRALAVLEPQSRPLAVSLL